jgi:hypothetical protein
VRRLLGVLAMLSLVMALSVTTASAQVMTDFELRAARLIQKGSAVDLTFNVPPCGLDPPLSDFHFNDYTMTARVDQRVGTSTVTSVPGVSVSGICPDSRTPVAVTVRVYAPDARKLKFRPKSAQVTATLEICYAFGGCERSTATTVIRLSKKSR